MVLVWLVHVIHRQRRMQDNFADDGRMVESLDEEVGNFSIS